MKLRLTIFGAIAAAMIIGNTSNAGAVISYNTSATQSGGTLLDFEGFTNGTNAANLFQPNGLEIRGFSTPTIFNPPVVSDGQKASSGSGVLGPGNPSSPSATSLLLLFGSNRSFVEFFFADTSPGGDGFFTFRLVGPNNGLLASTSLAVSNAAVPNFGYLSFVRPNADIRAIEIIPSYQFTEGWSIDDLRYGTTAVPLPAALPLLGAGIALLGLAGWRRKHKTA